MIKHWRKQWFRRQRRLRRSMHNTRLYAVFGRHVLHPRLWRSDKRSIAGGLALGLFVAFVPIPIFQMLLVVGGAILWKVNMPLGVAACWVTNPITAVPIFVAAYKTGSALLTHNEQTMKVVSLFVPQGKTGNIIREGIYLTTGSLLFAVLAAVIGYLSVQLLWTIMERLGVARKKTAAYRLNTEDCRPQTEDCRPKTLQLSPPRTEVGENGHGQTS
jgi:uncharacterized protein (DUF2062 family)